MLRVVGTAIRGIAARVNTGSLTITTIPRKYAFIRQEQQQHFSALSALTSWSKCPSPTHAQCNPSFSLIGQASGLKLIPEILKPQTRTLTKYSRKGKRTSVKAVVTRFYRLNWGIWIRTRAGRTNRLWRKKAKRKVRLRRHVFCNATQSTLLDKMVTSFWRRPRYYVDDPYNPYHKREEFIVTRKEPLP